MKFLIEYLATCALDDVHGVDHIAQTFGHFLALGIAHNAVQHHLLQNVKDSCISKNLTQSYTTSKGSEPVTMWLIITMRATQKNKMS